MSQLAPFQLKVQQHLGNSDTEDSAATQGSRGEDADLNTPGKHDMVEGHTPYSSLKKLLSLLNSLVAISGMMLISLGLAVKYGDTELTKVFGVCTAHLLHSGFLCLVLGCVAVLMGFAGCYGAAKESRGTLLTCFLCMVIVLLVEVTATSVILAFLPVVQDMSLEHSFLTLKRNYRGYNEPDDYSTQWNTVMEKLKCCGVNNYTDFSGSSFQMTSGHNYPRGCCRFMGTAACDGHNVSSEVIHQEGCFFQLLNITKTQSFTLSGVSLGAAAMQLPGILATLLLFIKLG